MCSSIWGAYPSRGHLQPSPDLLCRWPSHFSLARFRSSQRTEADDSIARRVLAPLPVAPAPPRFRTHPQLRLSGQPQACHSVAALLSVARLGATTASRTTRFLLHQRRARSLALSQLWWADGGRRAVYNCRNATSFSTAGRCRLKRLSPTRILRVSRRAPSLCVLPHNKSLPSDSSTTLFAIFLRGIELLGAWCHVSHALAQLRRTFTPLIPSIEFA